MICYVEDDGNIRDLVVYTLSHAGFPTQGFKNAAEFFAACEASVPELVLLDIMLPGEDGISILKKLRSSAKTRHVPVIMVTAKGAEYDKVVGLDTGADDYISKPFGMMEFVARVRAILRRSNPGQSPDTLSAGGLVVDRQKHTVSSDGGNIVLTLKEFDLLCFLMERKGMVFTRESILESVWNYSYEGGTRTVDVHVTTLRQKLGEYGSLIETVRGVGYRFGG